MQVTDSGDRSTDSPSPGSDRWFSDCWPMLSMKTFALLTLLAIVGCQSTRSSMQMDSDGRTPFFNFQIPVGNTDSEATVVEASATDSSAVSANIHQLGLQHPDPQPKKWGGWLDKLRQPTKSIPLPRTDLDDDGTVLESDESLVDGLNRF